MYVCVWVWRGEGGGGIGLGCLCVLIMCFVSHQRHIIPAIMVTIIRVFDAICVCVEAAVSGHFVCDVNASYTQLIFCGNANAVTTFFHTHTAYIPMHGDPMSSLNDRKPDCI